MLIKHSFSQSRILHCADQLLTHSRASPHNILPLGSDFPVEGINPLLGFYAAVTRLDVHGDSPHGESGWWAVHLTCVGYFELIHVYPRYTSESLTRAQALKGMTLDAAYASFNEEDIGSLVKGKKADYVILSQDILDEVRCPASSILQSQVLATVVDGRLLYGTI